MNYAQTLAAFAQRLYGDQWQAPLARALGVPKLRVHRLSLAVAAGKDYQGSRELLVQLQRQLAQAARDIGAELII